MLVTTAIKCLLVFRVAGSFLSGLNYLQGSHHTHTPPPWEVSGKTVATTTHCATQSFLPQSLLFAWGFSTEIYFGSTRETWRPCFSATPLCFNVRQISRPITLGDKYLYGTLSDVLRRQSYQSLRQDEGYLEGCLLITSSLQMNIGNCFCS